MSDSYRGDEGATQRSTLSERFNRFTLTVRRITIAFIVGAGVGAYGMYNMEHYNTEHLGSLADRGYCAARDVDHNRYWYACQDAFIAAQLQQHDAERDQEVTAVLNSMELNQPRKPKPIKVKQP